MKVEQSSIYLRDMLFHACHGVTSQEHKVGHEFTVNIRIDYPLEAACRTDALEDTLNYAELFDIVREEMAHECKLIEHLAGRIAGRIFGSYPLVTTVDIDICKHNPPIGGNLKGAGVHISFKNQQPNR